MNRERLSELADAIEAGREDLDFNMVDWIDDCGTTACIAGWACAVFAPKDWEQMTAPHYTGLYPRAASDRGVIADVAAEELGFANYLEARPLFNPTNHLAASRNQAVRVLRHAANTGTIDWSV